MQKKIIITNIGIWQFRWWWENFDLNIAKEFYLKWYKVEFYYLRPYFSKDKHSFQKQYITHPIKSPWLYPITAFMHKIPIIKNLWILRWFPRIIWQMIFEYKVFLKLKRLGTKDFFLHTCALPFLSFLAYNKLWIKAVTRWPWPIWNFYDSYFANKNWKMIANWDAFKQISNKFSNCYKVNVWVNKLFLNSKLSKKEAVKELNLDTNTIHLLFVWRLIPIKNIQFLINVFLKIQKNINVKLIIIWEWFQKNQFIEDVNNKWIAKKVIFENFKNQEELITYYKACDLFLITSTYDNFPNVLIECWACWLPAIGSKVGWIWDIISNWINWYCLPLKEDQFVKTIIESINNKDMLKLMSSNSIKTIKNNYSWNKTFEKYVSLLNN